jgi:hypothetical protein
MTHTQPTALQIAEHLLNGEPYTIAPAAAAELRRLHAIEAALAQPTSGNYALGYADGFNDACKPAQPAQEPDYAYPTIEGYEEITGFKVNDTFKMGWVMARTTNDLFKQMEKNT